MSGSKGTLPRIIWVLWFQGLERAPRLVKRCVDSWKTHNPGWEVVVLDESNLDEHIKVADVVETNTRWMTKQALSDIVRINLLARHGGVWVDATCFCCKPLDDWIAEYMSSGFFAFRSPGVDRPISSWFLSSHAGSLLTSKYRDAVNSYWRGRRFRNQGNRFGKLVDRHLHRRLKNARHESARFRSLFRMMTRLRVFPYFWFHYLFALLTTDDPAFRSEWAATPELSADIPHRVQLDGALSPLTEMMKDELDRKAAPFYKLRWQYDDVEWSEDCVLSYLLRES